jgi:SAM-dependent methyltransferase
MRYVTIGTTVLDAIGGSLSHGVPQERMTFINKLIARHGPEPLEYPEFTAWIDSLAEDIKAGRTTEEAVYSLWRELTRRHFRGSLQGLVVEIPHGYHGDFEFIDGVHCERISPDPTLARWDGYLQAQAAPKAVRNRRDYFHQLLKSVGASQGSPLRVLNVASGPSRDVRQWLDLQGPDAAHFDCVDLDANAIRFGKVLCEGYADSVRFFQGNALTFKPPYQYGLIWSAGLFDYLEDRLFVRLLRRLLRFTQNGGEVVVGNFGDYNPTRNYMELLGRWKLIHRSRQQLLKLAVGAGVSMERVRIDQEPEGVNLFLRIKVP